MDMEQIYGMTHTDGTLEEVIAGITKAAAQRAAKETFRIARANLSPDYNFNYTEPKADAPAKVMEQIAQEIGKHIGVDDLIATNRLALDAALEQAVGSVERTGGWILKKSSSGGSYVYNQRGGGTYHLPDDVAEMLHAFVSGDMLTALRLRDDLHEALPVAP